MASPPRSNRGPGAATENRAALIAAAREIFATRGIHAPLSSVAKEAGVGQGSLYRHFPTRSSLAVAVFQQNVDELELLAAREEATFGDVLRLITEQAIVSTALFEMIETDQAESAADELAARVDAVLASKMDRARDAGELSPSTTADDVRLGIAMLAGALAKTQHDQRRRVAARIWALLPFGPSEPA
jgi:AcrR family transcriptional regulator